MPGIWDKIKKFGSNLWNTVKTVAPTLINTIAPTFGPQGAAVGQALNTGINAISTVEDSVRSARSSFNDRQRMPAIRTGPRIAPAILSQRVNYGEG